MNFTTTVNETSLSHEEFKKFLKYFLYIKHPAAPTCTLEFTITPSSNFFVPLRKYLKVNIETYDNILLRYSLEDLKLLSVRISCEDGQGKDFNVANYRINLEELPSFYPCFLQYLEELARSKAEKEYREKLNLRHQRKLDKFLTRQLDKIQVFNKE
jgi:hypothetical protein